MTDLTDLTLSDTLAVTGASTLTGATTVTGALTANGGIVTGATAGVTTNGAQVKLEETVGFAAFTDGASTVGTYAITVGTIPAGATFQYAAVTAITGFAGDTSAVLTFGDGTDVDRYNTSTADVFTTAANGIACGIPSGVVYHAAAKTVTLTITVATDWTAVSAGSVTVELYYLT